MLHPSLNIQSCCQCCELSCISLLSSLQGKSQSYFSRGLFTDGLKYKLDLFSNLQPLKFVSVLERRADAEQLYFSLRMTPLLVHRHARVCNATSISTHNKAEPEMLVWVKQKPTTWGKRRGGCYIPQNEKMWRWIRREMRIFYLSAWSLVNCLFDLPFSWIKPYSHGSSRTVFPLIALWSGINMSSRLCGRAGDSNWPRK